MNSREKREKDEGKKKKRVTAASSAMVQLIFIRAMMVFRILEVMGFPSATRTVLFANEATVLVVSTFTTPGASEGSELWRCLKSGDDCDANGEVRAINIGDIVVGEEVDGE